MLLSGVTGSFIGPSRGDKAGYFPYRHRRPAGDLSIRVSCMSFSHVPPFQSETRLKRIDSDTRSGPHAARFMPEIAVWDEPAGPGRASSGSQSVVSGGAVESAAR